MNNMTSKYPHQTHRGDAHHMLLFVPTAFFFSVLLSPLSMFFMMWWGYGGHEPIAPPILQSEFMQKIAMALMIWSGYGGYAAIAPPSLQSESMQMAMYVSVTLVFVHSLFFWTNRIIRNSAVCAILLPWLLVYSFVIPQLFQQPAQSGIKAVHLLLVPVYVLMAQMVIERVFYRKRVW